MTRMTETERQARSERVAMNATSIQRQSILDWHQVMLILGTPKSTRIGMLREIGATIDRLIYDEEHS